MSACTRAGCDNEAVVRMGQDSVWSMVFPAPHHEGFLCEKCAVDCELVGGVRIPESRLAEYRQAVADWNKR